MVYLVPVATMALMAISVAVILGVVKNLLTVEGEAKVKIVNDGNELVLPLEQNLMQSLKKAGYDLFAQCGGKGTCATCRVKVLDGLKPEQITPAMLGPLSDKLRKEGWVLSCQISVKNDLTIELFKPLVMSWPKVEGKAVEEAPKAPALSPAAAKLRAVLPGFDCSACGYPTCEEFAEALAAGKAKLDGCYPGGKPVLERLRQAAAEVGVRVS
ncbi:MAG: 2Fe-2S iron-sulfur cluster-binding protein [Candidatus Bipolaricaulota bacterium]|nr:2Fe-2S iron-sulfur cluster-binding protein [Candidatus Bipolaricaulota bacterium]MDW8031172.1 (Fe-S)-binding protein [Candidatus Bipolaricaulota bacterium]